MTVMVAGLQIIRSNAPGNEGFKWKNKKTLFNLIRKHKKSGAMFLSGDVHFANRYQTPCESLTGYTLPEFTSSGMTHTVETNIKYITFWMVPTFEMFTDPIYSTEKNL